MPVSRSRVRRHTRPGHICCYLGPVHVPRSVYDAWRAIADVRNQARFLRWFLAGWIVLMYLLSLTFAVSGMFGPALTLQAIVAAFTAFYVLRLRPRRTDKEHN